MSVENTSAPGPGVPHGQPSISEPEPGDRAEPARGWRGAVGRLRRHRDDHADTGAGTGAGTKEPVVVIGLGRFGAQVSTSLMRLGHEVLAIDADQRTVQQWSDRLTHVAQADGTDEEALRQLSVNDFPHAVVGVGTHIEASVLTVVALVDIGVPEIWAKAISTKHGKILSAVGAHHVVYPEAAMGDRVAHLLTGRMLDFIELDDGFALAETFAPADTIGRTLTELEFRSRYGVVVVGARAPDGRFDYATRDTVLAEGSVVIVAGPTDQVQWFATEA